MPVFMLAAMMQLNGAAGRASALWSTARTSSLLRPTQPYFQPTNRQLFQSSGRGLVTPARSLLQPTKPTPILLQAPKGNLVCKRFASSGSQRQAGLSPLAKLAVGAAVGYAAWEPLKKLKAIRDDRERVRQSLQTLTDLKMIARMEGNADKYTTLEELENLMATIEDLRVKVHIEGELSRYRGRLNYAEFQRKELEDKIFKNIPEIYELSSVKDDPNARQKLMQATKELNEKARLARELTAKARVAHKDAGLSYLTQPSHKALKEAIVAIDAYYTTKDRYNIIKSSEVAKTNRVQE